MKKILTICLIIMSLFLNAAIITIDNNFPSMGDYTTLQAAHDAANSGDTLFLTPSFIGYRSCNLTKPLTIIGNGYSDTAPSSLPYSVIWGDFSITAEASGGKLLSLDIGSYMFIYASNYTIEKCRSTWNIKIMQGASNVLLRQNKIKRLEYQNQTIITLYNNYFLTSNHFCLWSELYQVAEATLNAFNNLFISDYQCSIQISGTNSLFVNNIIFPNQSGILTSYNNIVSDGSLPPTNGNQLNVDLNTIFLDYQNGNFHLKPGSPAIGAGLNGEDIGIYGGDFPFVDGGAPPFPTIYHLDVPHTGNSQNGVNITIKAKSNN